MTFNNWCFWNVQCVFIPSIISYIVVSYNFKYQQLILFAEVISTHIKGMLSKQTREV